MEQEKIIFTLGDGSMEKFFAISEEKQTTIRNAALACFAKHGYEKASINDIASAAGISKASMFQYFGSKPALYEYLLHYCVSQMKKSIRLEHTGCKCGLLRPGMESQRDESGKFETVSPRRRIHHQRGYRTGGGS